MSRHVCFAYTPSGQNKTAGPKLKLLQLWRGAQHPFAMAACTDQNRSLPHPRRHLNRVAPTLQAKPRAGRRDPHQLRQNRPAIGYAPRDIHHTTVSSAHHDAPRPPPSPPPRRRRDPAHRGRRPAGRGRRGCCGYVRGVLWLRLILGGSSGHHHTILIMRHTQPWVLLDDSSPPPTTTTPSRPPPNPTHHS